MNEKRYTCCQCSTRIAKATVLYSHGPTGTEFRAYICGLCEKIKEDSEAKEYLDWLENNVRIQPADLVSPNDRIRKLANRRTSSTGGR